jgi:hypothetical protein
MKKLLFLLLFVILLSGCRPENKVAIQASPTFKSGVYTFYGLEGNIGLLAPGGFIANKANKYMWHFWGTKEELAQKPFRVEAINLKTNKKVKALALIPDNNTLEMVWEYAGSLGGPNNGADAHLPSSLKLPTSGLWQLDAYLGGKLKGSIVVDVK